MNILIIGSGMYVCGRGTKGHGTILPALLELQKNGAVQDILLMARSANGRSEAETKASELGALMGIAPKLRFFELGEDFGKSLDQVLSAHKVQAAFVCTPDHTHFVFTRELLNRGLHCAVVKPLCETVQQVEELAALAGKKSLYGYVEFHKRYDRSNLKLKEFIRSGAAGDLLYFVVEYSQRKTVPRDAFKGWAADSNIFQYLGVHYVDMVHFCTGARPLRVLSTGQKSYLKGLGIDTYDAIQTLVEWEGKDGKRFNSTFITNWIDPDTSTAMSDQRIKVVGTKGRFTADQMDRGISVLQDGKGPEHVNPDFCQLYPNDDGTSSYQGYGIHSVQRFVLDALDITAGRKKAIDLEGKRPTFSDALVPTHIVEASNQSLAQGGSWIEI